MRRLLLLLMLIVPNRAVGQSAPMSFRFSPWFGERVREEQTADSVRLLINLPPTLIDRRPTRVVFYATPNGNTIEQTLGSADAPGLDWHFGIQHIAAQTRRLRQLDRTHNLILVVAQPVSRSWPLWRRQHADSGAVRLRSLVADLVARLPGGDKTITLAGHSGGGAFLFGFIDGGATIPATVDRIAFLDANYSYADSLGHGDKLIAWLRGDPARRLSVLAYDDRAITLNGRPIVGPTGGTYRATGRMLARFARDGRLDSTRSGDLTHVRGVSGGLRVSIDRNPRNEILHTVLVETNGFLKSLTVGTAAEHRWGRYRGERAYARWIQPATATAPVGDVPLPLPPRPADAEGGRAFMARIAPLDPAEREAAIGAEMLRGNLPDFLRRFKLIDVAMTDSAGRRHVAQLAVAPDVLAVGSDSDFVRIPMTPTTAQRIADRFGCSLPTRRLSDAIWQRAEIRLEPVPLTERREAVETFVQSNDSIEVARGTRPLGALIAGIKKDVVLTDRLLEAPARVAIYGWHHRDGTPIQPLYVGHRASYVDYSHGIRLIRRAMTVDGQPTELDKVLRDPILWPLVSDEGPIQTGRFP